MFTFSLLSIPEEFGDLWYVYDLLLLCAIAICAVVLAFLKKRSFEREALKNAQKAKSQLIRATSADATHARILLFSASKLFASAVYNLERALEKTDKYELNSKIAAFKNARDSAEDLSKGDPSPDAIRAILDELAEEI